MASYTKLTLSTGESNRYYGMRRYAVLRAGVRNGKKVAVVLKRSDSFETVRKFAERNGGEVFDAVTGERF